MNKSITWQGCSYSLLNKLSLKSSQRVGNPQILHLKAFQFESLFYFYWRTTRNHYFFNYLYSACRKILLLSRWQPRGRKGRPIYFLKLKTLIWDAQNPDSNHCSTSFSSLHLVHAKWMPWALSNFEVQQVTCSYIFVKPFKRPSFHSNENETDFTVSGFCASWNWWLPASHYYYYSKFHSKIREIAFNLLKNLKGNLGLIISKSTYSKIFKYGFIH